MVPKRIIRFLYECFKYELLNRDIIDKVENKYFNFNNFEKDDKYFTKIIYLFVSNFPYIYDNVNSEDKEKYLNKLIEAKNLFKNNFSRIKLDQYKNKGDYDYLEIMIENYIESAKENKLDSYLMLDLDKIDFSENNEKDQEDENEYKRNLGNLHTSLKHAFERNLPDKINLLVKFKIIT